MTIAILILVILLFIWVIMMAAAIKGFIDKAKVEVIRVIDHNTKEALEMIFNADAIKEKAKKGWTGVDDL